MASKDAQMNGRLRAPPGQGAAPAPLGLQPLILGAARDSYLYMPATHAMAISVTASPKRTTHAATLIYSVLRSRRSSLPATRLPH